ncbi:MAG: hypothetical protein WCB68_12355 [Pyrinomonadaceae bacterium]
MIGSIQRPLSSASQNFAPGTGANERGSAPVYLCSGLELQRIIPVQHAINLDTTPLRDFND